MKKHRHKSGSKKSKDEPLKIQLKFAESDGKVNNNKSPLPSPGGTAKKKIGITIKKSPNSDRTFETALLGGDDEIDYAEDEESEEEDSEEEAVNDRKRKSIFMPRFDCKLFNKQAKVTLKKVDDARQERCTTAAILASDSDSEYETEEVYELCEWFPPDFWRSKVEAEPTVCTDVTVDQITVTMVESRTRDGFFRQ